VVTATQAGSEEKKPGRSLWCVYSNWTREYPGKFVARRWLLDARDPRGGIPTSDVRLGDTLNEVRWHIPVGFICQQRNPMDQPEIVEVWL